MEDQVMRGHFDSLKREFDSVRREFLQQLKPINNTLQRIELRMILLDQDLGIQDLTRRVERLEHP